MNAPCRDCPERCIGCRRSCRRWKAYQLTLKIIKERAKKHRYLDPMPDSRTNEVKNRTKKYKGFSQGGECDADTPHQKKVVRHDLSGRKA